MSTQSQINPVLTEFAESDNSIMGVCFDAIRGFDLNLKEIDRTQREFLEQSGTANPSDEDLQLLDSAWIIYSHGSPSDSEKLVYHQGTQRDFKTRNSQGGSNEVFIGNMTLISIFEYWEETCRPRLAAILDVHKDQVECDIFGDLRIIRNSILHHSGIALDDVNRCKVLKWFKAGDKIMVDRPRLRDLVTRLEGLEIRVVKRTSPA